MKYFIKIETNKDDLTYQIVQKLVGFCFGILVDSEMKNGDAKNEIKNFWSYEKKNIPDIEIDD